MEYINSEFQQNLLEAPRLRPRFFGLVTAHN